MWSAEPLASDPRNHCVAVHDVLQSPLDEDIAFIVLPFLRLYDKPRFRTFGEAVDCFRQLIEVTSSRLDHIYFDFANCFPRACNSCMNITSPIG